MRVRAPNNTPAALRKSACMCTIQLFGLGLSLSQQWKPCQQKSEAINVKVELFMWLVSALFVAVKSLFDFIINTFTRLSRKSRFKLKLHTLTFDLAKTEHLWQLYLALPLSKHRFTLVGLGVLLVLPVPPVGQQTKSRCSERCGCMTHTALEQMHVQLPSVFTTVIAFKSVSWKCRSRRSPKPAWLISCSL